MARMGRLAERALEAIERDGHFDVRTPWIRQSEYSDQVSLRRSRFPSVPSFSRDDVPGYGPVSFSGGPVWLKETKRTRQSCFTVTVHGALYGGGLLSEGSAEVGHVRLTSGGGTFYAARESGVRYAIPLLRAVSRARANEMARAVASCLAGAAARTESGAATYQRLMRSWLYEDGHAARMLTELRETADSYRTVNRVLTE